MVKGTEGGGEGTPAPRRLGDYTARHFERVSRFKLQLRDRQEARRSRRGVGVTDPHQWRGDGAWMRPRI